MWISLLIGLLSKLLSFWVILRAEPFCIKKCTGKIKFHKTSVEKFERKVNFTITVTAARWGSGGYY